MQDRLSRLVSLGGLQSPYVADTKVRKKPGDGRIRQIARRDIEKYLQEIELVVVGGESDKNARPSVGVAV